MERRRTRSLRRTRVLVLASMGGVLALGLLGSTTGRTRAEAVDPTPLDTVTLTAPAATTTLPGVDVALGAFTVAGSDDLAITLEVKPVGSGVLTLGCSTTCADVTYEVGDGDADALITLSGTSANVTAALTSVTLVAPSAGAVEVVATIDDHTATAPGPNGHQYRYYPTHVTWTAARAAASALSLYGKTGYLVTVMSVEEETYLETLIGSESVHLGLTGKSARGRNAWTWTYADGPDSGVTPAYFDWLPKEPRTPKQGVDDYGRVRVRTTGGKTAWDVSIDNSACCGYVVEFGDADPPVPRAVVAVWVGEGPPPTEPPTTVRRTTVPPLTLPDTTVPDTTVLDTVPDTTVAPSTVPASSAAPRVTTTIAPTTAVPAGWAADIKVGARLGEPSPGAEVTVRGKGLEPGRSIEFGVRSTYRVLATGTVDSDGEFELSGRLPADLEPGTHTIEVHYAGEPAVLDSATFAIGAAGTLETGEQRLGFGAYDPGANATVVVGATVAALAVAGAAGAAGGGGGGAADSAGQVGEIDVEDALEVDLDGERWGDRSLTWRAPGNERVERFALAFERRLGAALPGVTRAMVGESYLRAMFGSLSVLLPLAGLVLGVVAAASTGFDALPPTVAVFGAILVLSALDGIAGFAAGIGYAIPLLASGAVTSLNSVLVVAGTVVAMTGVSLMAEMVRPLTRPPGRGWEARWNRLGDAVIGALFVGWLIRAAVGSLEGLRGYTLEITDRADLLAIVAMVGIVSRISLESLATNVYPARMRVVRPHNDEVPEYGLTRRWVMVFARTGALMLAAKPFVGWNWYLWVGCASYCAEQLLDVVEDRIPVVKRFAPLVPLRVYKFITALLLCTVVARLLENRTGGVQLVRVAFVVLNVPMTAVETFIALGREGERGPVTWWRRLGGVAMITLGFLAVTGHLL
jgi:hypothetical protein